MTPKPITAKSRALDILQAGKHLSVGELAQELDVCHTAAFKAVDALYRKERLIRIVRWNRAERQGRPHPVYGMRLDEKEVDAPRPRPISNRERDRRRLARERLEDAPTIKKLGMWAGLLSTSKKFSRDD